MKEGLVSKGLCMAIAFAVIFCAVRVHGETVISEQFRKEVEKGIDRVETEGPKAVQLASELKAVGASYIPEILAPVNPEKYQDEERQSLITGIYTMDLQYATAFEKEKEMVDYGLAVYSMCDRLGFPVPQVEQQLRDIVTHMDDPDIKQKFDALADVLGKDDSWKGMLSTPRGIRFIVEGLYSFILEGIYITSEMAAQSNYNPEFLKVLNAHKTYLKIYSELLDQFVGKPELASVLRKPERMDTIKTLLTLMSGPNPIGKNEVEEIRKIAAPARNQIIK